MNPKRHLFVFANPNQPVNGDLPRPTLAEVLYSPPNPNGTRKACMNCVLWFASDENCLIHDMDVVAPADAICGYHVFGSPMPGAYVQHPGMMPVTPELSGLIQVTGGTSCDRCHWYRKRSGTEGTCVAVRELDGESDTDALVSGLGCCTRWEAEHRG